MASSGVGLRSRTFVMVSVLYPLHSLAFLHFLLCAERFLALYRSFCYRCVDMSVSWFLSVSRAG